MKWSGINQIYVTGVGLADGLVHILYDKYQTAQTANHSTPVAI
jgi:hypothetical protein